MFVFAVLDRWVRILDIHLSARAGLDHRQTFFFHCEFRRGRCINCKTKISVYKEQIFAKLYLLWYLMACRHGLNNVNLFRWEPSSSRTKFSSGGQMFTQTFREALERVSAVGIFLSFLSYWNANAFEICQWGMGVRTVIIAGFLCRWLTVLEANADNRVH